jgi:hypothetical protein
MTVSPESLAAWMNQSPLQKEGDSHGALTSWLFEFLQNEGEDVIFYHRRQVYEITAPGERLGELKMANTYFFRWNGEMWWARGKTSDEELAHYGADRLDLPKDETGRPLWENTFVEGDSPRSGFLHRAEFQDWGRGYLAFIEQENLKAQLPEAETDSTSGVRLRL